jgi:L-amino acid N-acyltransferase YncA
MNVRIVPLTVEQWPEVSAIYAEGIASGHATFESKPPDWASSADCLITGTSQLRRDTCWVG